VLQILSTTARRNYSQDRREADQPHPAPVNSSGMKYANLPQLLADFSAAENNAIHWVTFFG